MIVQSRLQFFDAAIQIGKHRIDDAVQRLGNVALQPVLQLRRVDAVIDELLVDVVERFGDAQDFGSALVAVRQRALHPQETQLAPPLRRIGGLFIAGLGSENWRFR